MPQNARVAGTFKADGVDEKASALVGDPGENELNKFRQG